ncbi:hypothetical protein ACFL1R_03725 [Candidatus Latescibacterota bacterium]
MKSKVLFLMAVFCFITSVVLPTAARQINVTDYGAVPSDDKDDTAEIQATVVALQNGDKLIFDKGQYDIYKTISIKDLDNIEVDGRGTTLMMKGYDRKTNRGAFTLFVLSNCDNLYMHELFIDQEPSRHMEGKIVNVTDEYLDLEIFREFLPITGEEAFGTVMDYYSDGTPCGKNFYQPKITKRELIKPNTLRLWTSQANLTKPGRYIVIRHTAYGPGTFSVSAVKGFTLRDVNVYAGGMVLSAHDRTSDILLERFNITFKPGTQRLMSANADGLHLNMCTGKITIKDSLLEGMGDDCINIHSMYGRVLSVDSANNKVVIEGAKRQTNAPGVMNRTVIQNYFLPGEEGIFYEEDQMAPKGKAVVKSFENQDATAVIEFESLPGGIEKGDLVDNITCYPSQVHLSDCKLGRNRARGFLLQVPNVIVENCEFYHSTSGGIWVITDTHFWYESGPVNNVLICNNRFIGCNKGETFREGAVLVFCENYGWQGYGPAGVHKNITIRNNYFQDTEASALFISSAEKVKVINNVIEDVSKDPGKISNGEYAIYVEKTNNCLISGNTVKNGNKIFGMDESSCKDVTFIP